MSQQRYDHDSDPQFVEYYARESQSEDTTERFRRIRDRAVALLKESGRDGQLDVADIGCGAGTQALLWAEIGHRVSALDVNEPLVSIARTRASERGLKIRFDVGTATKLPYADTSVDAVLLPELLEHVADWQTCLNEAVRVLRPGGLLYLSTTNWLCPNQQEFTLPLYSWYPGTLKRWCEHKAVTTHPQWANYARYPAVNWFSYFGLRDWLASRGFGTFDRFDILARQPLSGLSKTIVAAVRSLPPMRFIGHVLTQGTTVWALKRRPAQVRK